MLSLSILYIALLAFFVYVFVRPIIVYLLDPLDLRKYPAPSLLAATTPLWLLRETWLERRSATIEKEHKRLGDIIRVGPNQLLFNDPQAINDIYGHQAVNNISKDEGFYGKMAGDFRDIVNVRDRAEHSRKRRYLANSFALKTVVEMEPVIRANSEKLFARLDSYCTNNNKEMVKAGGHFNIRMWYIAIFAQNESA
jgi:cytochrome P450